MPGPQRAVSVLCAVTFLVDIVCARVLVPRLGRVGAAIGTSLTLGLLCVICLLMARSNLKLWPYDRRYAKGLLATAVASVALVLFRLLPVTSPSLFLLASIFVSASVFIAALIGLGLDAEDKEFLQLIWGRGLRQARGESWS